VAAVGSDNLVVWSQGGLHTDGNSFLLSHKVAIDQKEQW
jgi:hypothetical protein